VLSGGRRSLEIGGRSSTVGPGRSRQDNEVALEKVAELLRQNVELHTAALAKDGKGVAGGA